MAEEDDVWFSALAGQARAADANALAAQAAALRAAIRGRSVMDAGEVPATDPAREALLIRRARAAGVLPAMAPGEAQHGVRSKPRTLRWAALAAALACVVAGITLQMRIETTLVVRGDSAGVVHLQSRDPLRLKQDLLRELNAAGVRATGYEHLGRQGIDADVPAPRPEAFRKVLERHAIPLPAGSVLQIEIEPDGGP